MNQAFLTGIVGIQTHQYGIDVLSDNIANINTIGFRESRVEFGSLFESTLSANQLNSPTYDSIGVGSRVQATMMREEIGVMLPSDKTSSLAIDGEGWFGVSQGRETYYTRTGNFLFDADRNLVTTDGFYVMGSMAGNISNGELTEVIDSVELAGVEGQVLLLPGALTFPGEASTVAHFKGNLGITDVEQLVSAEVIDNNNDTNRLALRFDKSAVQPAEGTAWDITASIANRDGSTIYDTATGTATFSGNGAILDYSLPTMSNNGAPVTIDLGTGHNGIIAIDSLSAGTFSSTSDGSQSGQLTGYEVSQNGDIIVAFDNGRQSAIAKIALYHFQNDQGLERVGGTRYQATSNSGEPIIYTNEDGEYITGSRILGNMLESSNVRLETALTELIIMQRAFDANAKSITTGDELIQKALQMDA